MEQDNQKMGKTAWITLSILGLLLLGGIILFTILNQPQSIVNSIGGPDNVQWSKFSEDTYAYNYKYTITPSDPTNYKFGTTTNLWGVSVPAFSSDTFAPLPSDFNKNIKYTTKDVAFSISASISNNDPTSVPIEYISKTGECFFEGTVISARGETIPVNAYQCSFEAKVKETANFYGLTRVIAYISVPKSNYECGQYTIVPEDKECINGMVIAKVSSATEQPTYSIEVLSTQNDSFQVTIMNDQTGESETQEVAVGTTKTIAGANILIESINTDTNEATLKVNGNRVKTEVKEGTKATTLIITISSILVILLIAFSIIMLRRKK